MNTFTNLSAEAKAFYDKTMLMRAKANLKIMKAARMADVKRNDGNSVNYRRLERLTPSTTALSEGITPTSQSMSVTAVTVNVAQYGGYVTLSDQLQLMAIDPLITEAVELLSQQAGESLESVILNELVTGTNIQYVTGSARNAQTTSSLLTSAVVRKGVRSIHQLNAKPMEGDNENRGLGGKWFGYIHTNIWYDYRNDATTVNNTAIYSLPAMNENLYFMDFDGVMWHASTLAPVFSAAGATSNDVYATFIFGKEAFGCVNVAGTGKFNTFTQQLGSGGTSDPLHQRATVGYKFYQAPKILNNNFGVRIESGYSG